MTPDDLVDQPQLQMILQVLADARLVEHERNAELGKLRGRTDAGQQQRLRRADRARRQDHLAAAARDSLLAVLPPAHAGGALAVELEAFDQAAGLEPQILPVQHRLEEAARRRPAPPALLVDVEIAAALVVAGVEIVGFRDAGLLRGLAERVEDVPAHARILDPPFAAARVMLAVAEEMIDAACEIAAARRPSPSR